MIESLAVALELHCSLLCDAIINDEQVDGTLSKWVKPANLWPSLLIPGDVLTIFLFRRKPIILYIDHFGLELGFCVAEHKVKQWVTLGVVKRIG